MSEQVEETAKGATKGATKAAGMDAKGMLKKHGEAGTKIRYQDRVCLKVIKETKFYRKGQIINPHPVMGDQLIADGIASPHTAKKK